MIPEPRSVGVAGAIALRNRSAAIRLVLMAIIALLLWRVGGWTWAGLWWAVYAAIQLALAKAAHLPERWLTRAVYGLSFTNFAVAGFPAWHLWTEKGDLGMVAATMFLCGMLVQLVASTLAAPRLFWSSAAPLIGYLLLTPLLALEPDRTADGLTILACAAILVFYMGVLRRDQQKVIEAMEFNRQEAEAASRAKTEFLAAMSHEIRTPMNAVLGAAALLGRTELTPQQREQVAMLEDGGALLMQVLNDVLDLSKIEAGKLSIERSATDLHGFVQRCAAFWRPRALDAGLELAVELAPGTPPYVRIDPIRTGQIVFNLLSNAVKFTAKGKITLSVEVRDKGFSSHDLVLSVSDTGIGIAPEAMRRLFAAFEQADGSITRRYGGSGLGLAIGQRLARMMGGTLSAASEPGVGSAFVLCLPVALCAAPQAAPETAPDPQGLSEQTHPLRILVAEDNPANQRIIELFLSPLAADVVMVANGAEAVAALGDAPYDVVLMDMQMPVMDGLEAARLVRASGGPNARTPILALTANVMETHQKACLEAGMDGHIAKPIDARVLLSAVAAAAGGHVEPPGMAAVAADCTLGAEPSAP